MHGVQSGRLPHMSVGGAMASELAERRIERLLDEIDTAEASGNLQLVLDRARDVLRIDEDNLDARAYLESAVRQLGLAE